MRWKLLSIALFLGTGSVLAQTPSQAAPPPAAQIWTWDQVKDRFETNNPTLLASFLNVDEMKAQEITAHLRPNPDFTFSADGTQIAPSHGVWQPFAGTLISPGRQLFIRAPQQARPALRGRQARHVHRRRAAVRLRAHSDLQSAQRFRRRPAGQGRAERLAQDNLEYYDKILKISRDRYEAGDIAQIDLDRLELQRLQYESDVQTALVNLRTTKINLLAMLNDRRPVESYRRRRTLRFHRKPARARRLSQTGTRHSS